MPPASIGPVIFGLLGLALAWSKMTGGERTILKASDGLGSISGDPIFTDVVRNKLNQIRRCIMKWRFRI